MKSFFKKCKEYFSRNEVKASFGMFAIMLLIAMPLLVIWITLLLQYAVITPVFWVIIFIAICLFALLIAFSTILYEKLLANYENRKITKCEYRKKFLSELTGPFVTGFLLVTMIIFLDQFTKIQAIIHLEGKSSVVFIKGFLNWSLAYNKGAAWSMCSNHTNMLAILSLVASFVILYFMKDFNLRQKPLYSLALAFILGGTVGNMIDRFFRSNGVVDFIETAFMDFPIFNVADSFLVVGTILLAIVVLFDVFQTSSKTKKQSTEDSDARQEENAQ